MSRRQIRSAPEVLELASAMAACSCAESTERLSDAHPASNAPCAEGAHAGGQVIGLLVQQSVLELSGLADYFGLSD